MTTPPDLMADLASLAALDKELDAHRICECACAEFPDRHGPPQCVNVATFYVEVHVWGLCQSPAAKADPNITLDGDKACYLCRECLDSALAFAQARLAKLPPHACCPQWPAAQGCGRPMTTLDDYIPARRPL